MVPPNSLHLGFAKRIEACWSRGCLLSIRVRRASAHYTAGIGETKNIVDGGLNAFFFCSGDTGHYGKRGWQLRGDIDPESVPCNRVYFSYVDCDESLATRLPDRQHTVVVLVFAAYVCSEIPEQVVVLWSKNSTCKNRGEN